MKEVAQVVAALLASKAWSAVKYISPTKVVRATRRRSRGRFDGRSNVEVLVTVGRPNYREVQFVKLAKRAGEPFPVRKVQLRQLPHRRR